MKSRTPISLFPFLSVLVSTMGVLSLLAVTFSMFAGSDARQPTRKAARRVDVRWVGAPPYVRPLLVECRADGAYVRGQGGEAAKFYSKLALQNEARTVRDLEELGMRRMGLSLGRQTMWLFFKSALENEPRLKGTLTLAMHQLELSNLNGPNRQRREEHYPILLVYPNGIETYEVASYLIETTTRLSTGVEPMLAGWALPDYRGGAGKAGSGGGAAKP
jgi:hypothetical protein